MLPQTSVLGGGAGAHSPVAELQPAELHAVAIAQAPPTHSYESAPWHSWVPEVQAWAELVLHMPSAALQPADPHELASTHASLTHWYEFPPWHSSADPEHAGG